MGVIALAGGVTFVSYDDNVSPLVADAAKSTIGAYIAQEIVKRVNATPSIVPVARSTASIQ